MGTRVTKQLTTIMTVKHSHKDQWEMDPGVSSRLRLMPTSSPKLRRLSFSLWPGAPVLFVPIANFLLNRIQPFTVFLIWTSILRNVGCCPFCLGSCSGWASLPEGPKQAMPMPWPTEQRGDAHSVHPLESQRRTGRCKPNVQGKWKGVAGGRTSWQGGRTSGQKIQSWKSVPALQCISYSFGCLPYLWEFTCWGEMVLGW